MILENKPVIYSVGLEELAHTVLKIVRNHGPLRFRQIEAYVVLDGIEISTYEVQRAIDLLLTQGKLKQTDNFRYTASL